MNAIKHKTSLLVTVLSLLIACTNCLYSCVSCHDPKQLERDLRLISQCIEDEYATENTQSHNSYDDKGNRRRRARGRRVKCNREGKWLLVFYAWGSGHQIAGHKSTFGHAFVDIPTIGPVGYSGKVTNHAEEVKYATYRCVVPVSDDQLQRAINKYWDWVNNTPEYELMNYDCTTFTLDIADAAGVKYGLRAVTWSPAGFLRALIEHNPQ
ncbi:MAG: hypothetical protein IJU81_01305 [Bacteroidales bacterium]|nr:hypothetical protein [Bacteroidales bacterium]